MKWMGSILVNTVLFMFLAWLIPNFHVASIGAALIASFILALVNALIRPIIVVITLPITFITLGIFLIVINATMLIITTKFMGDSFIINGFGTALIIAVLLSILNLYINSTLVKSSRKKS